MDLEDAWVCDKNVKYKKDVKLESSYLEVIARWTQNLDYIWAVAGQIKLASYNFDRNFENKVIENIGVLQSYNELWDYISESFSFDGYCSEVNFEDELNTEYYEKAFNYFSGIHSNLKYKSTP